MDQLYAVIDPNWGEPLVIVETIRKSPEAAIAEAIKHPTHSLYAGRGWDSMVPQGYRVAEVTVAILSEEIHSA